MWSRGVVRGYTAEIAGEGGEVMFKKKPKAVQTPSPRYSIVMSIQIIDQEEERINHYRTFVPVPATLVEKFTISADSFSGVLSVLQKFNDVAEAVKR